MAATADRDGGARQDRAEFALAAGAVAEPARRCHRVRRVEHHG